MSNCVTINDIDLINALLTALTLIVAILGISTWRTQLIGSYKFEKKAKYIVKLERLESVTRSLFNNLLVINNNNFNAKRIEPSLPYLKESINQYICLFREIEELKLEIHFIRKRYDKLFFHPFNTLLNLRNYFIQILKEIEKTEHSNSKNINSAFFHKFQIKDIEEPFLAINTLISLLEKI